MKKKAKDDYDINYPQKNQKLLNIENEKKLSLLDTEELLSQDSDILSLVDEVENFAISQKTARDAESIFIMRVWNAITKYRTVDFLMSPAFITASTLLFSIYMAYSGSPSTTEFFIKMLLPIAMTGGTVALDTVRINRLNHIKAENKVLGQIMTMQQIINRSLSNAKYINRLDINGALIKRMHARRESLLMGFQNVKVSSEIVVNSKENRLSRLLYDMFPLFMRSANGIYNFVISPSTLTIAGGSMLGYNLFCGTMIAMNSIKLVNDIEKIGKNYKSNSYLSGKDMGLEFVFGKSLEELKRYQIQIEAFAYAIRQITKKEIIREIADNNNREKVINNYFDEYYDNYKESMKVFQKICQQIDYHHLKNNHSDIIYKKYDSSLGNYDPNVVKEIIKARMENTVHIAHLALRNIVALDKEYKRLKYEELAPIKDGIREVEIDNKKIEIEKKIRALCSIYKDEISYLRYAQDARSNPGNIMEQKYMIEFVETHGSIIKDSLSQLVRQTAGNAASRMDTLHMRNMMINEEQEIKLYGDNKIGKKINIKEHKINKKNAKYLNKMLTNKKPAEGYKERIKNITNKVGGRVI